MTFDELREEIEIELEAMQKIIQELNTLHSDLADRIPTVREKTAAGAFLAQFYNGLENILKRISRYHQVPLPAGDTWHIELFQRFCPPPFGSLPLLFDNELASALAPFRRFRHVVFHGYSFQLDWERMSEGIGRVGNVFNQFLEKLQNYLNS